MSKPHTIYRKGAVESEIISAMSALNMHPEPIPKGKAKGAYLSETDKWAAHAMEHLRAAITFAGIVSSRVYQAQIALDALLHDHKDQKKCKQLKRALSYILGEVDELHPAVRTRKWQDHHGFWWVYDCGWHLLAFDTNEKRHPYRDTSGITGGISQPIGVLAFYKSEGVLPSAEGEQCSPLSK